MAEVIGNDGTWTFDGDVLRIVPGHGRGVHRLRRILGEIEVPLQAVAGVARLPHPAAPAETPALPAPETSEEDHDTLLRRLRELGELHKEGILTEEEFTTAKQAILRRL